VWRFVIPLGTAERLAAGEAVVVLPAELALRFDDTLILVNDDRVAHTVGPITIRPGQEVRRRVSRLQSLSGFCSLHPATGIEITVG
jgi:hypothetical protein